MNAHHDSSDSVPVLIVGGGVVGLCMALLLQSHGVRFALVERREHTATLPRSRGVHSRTVEIFRQLGIEKRVQVAAAHAVKAGVFGGARSGRTMLEAQSLEFGRREFGTPLGPSSFCFLPQVDLEPVLVDVLAERGDEVRFGTALTDFAVDADGVTAVLADRAGTRTQLRAEYLIAADGAGSGIRRGLGIPCWELPPTHHYINVYFHADLAALVTGRTFSQCEITGPVRGLMLSKNNTDEWSMHLEYDPTGESLDDYPADRCAALIRAAIGRADLDVEVLARTAWDTAAGVADEYGAERVLLVGDAAHRHAPWGGFGANTGVADAHNLAWKLAAVLAGTASPELLETYELERRPRAVLAARQARLRTDFHARFDIRTPDNAADVAKLLDMDTVMSRYSYASAEPLTALRGQVGSRVPHVWLSAGEGWEISTLDLCGPNFTLLTDVDGGAWQAAAAHAADATGLDVAAHVLGPRLVDMHNRWRAEAGLPDGGALLVRPDQHVLARSDLGLRPDTLVTTLESLVGGRTAWLWHEESRPA